VKPRRPSNSKPAANRSIVWSARAESDLTIIGDFIADDDPVAAQRWVSMIVATVERLAAYPHMGHRVPELGRDDLREVTLRSYRIVYYVSLEQIEVLTVFEGHRRLSSSALRSWVDR